MIKYSIYTEDKGNLGKIVGEYFPSFTITPTIGFWKGAGEKSVKVEILTHCEEEIGDRINRVAHEIKQKNKQESVLVSHENVEFELV